MPTLQNAKTKPGRFVIWKPHPNHGRPSTYQITGRALQLFRSIGYTVPHEGDTVEVPHTLCRPLRILGDLHFKEEESPGNVELTQKPSISDNYGAELSAEAESKLREYIETHPRLTEEKETELSEDLNRLNSDSDVQLDTDSRPDDKTSNGPVESVDIDPSDFFGDDNVLQPEVEKVVRGKEPVNVGEDIPKEIEDAMGQIGREEYYKSLIEIPGYRDSLKEFDDHPREITSIETQEDVLQYELSRIEHPQQGQWFVKIDDGRRTGDEVPDLQFTFTILSESVNLVKHEVQIDDGQFVSWTVSIGGENITGGTRVNDEVSGAEFHRILHDRAWLLQTIEEFVNELRNIEVHSPAEWKEFD